MRDAHTILELIRERGKKGLPLERVYRLLYNPDLYLMAYGRIYRNDGATTKGVTEETVDGMSIDKIKAIIEDIRHERYRWHPARRTYIPKKNGKKRPLGIQIWVSYCLSFQGVFGMPGVVWLGGRSDRPPIGLSLYHIWCLLTSLMTFPVLLGRFAKLGDDFWGEGNPARSMG